MMSAYRFDPAVEPATMLIQVQPRMYVDIADTLDEKVPAKQYYVNAEEVMKDSGKIVKEWVYDNAEVWVPERIGKILVKQWPNERPVAVLLATRNLSEAEKGTDTREAKKKNRRKRTSESRDDSELTED